MIFKFKILILLGVSTCTLFHALNLHSQEIEIMEIHGNVFEIMNIDNSEIEAVDYYNQAVECLDNYELDLSMNLFRKALSVFISKNSFKYIGDCYINIGIIYEIEGDFDLALENYNLALINYQKIGHKAGIADSYNNIGIIYCINSQYDKGLEFYLKSLEIEEERGNLSGISYSLGNIGLVYRKMDNDKKAIEYYMKSIEIKEKLKDSNGIALTNNNLGNVYKELDSLDVAMDYFDNALDLYLKSENIEGQAYSLHNMACVYLLQEDFDKALTNFKKSLIIRENLNDLKGQASTSYYIADSYFHKKQFSETYSYLKKTEALAVKMNYQDVLLDVYDLYYQYYQTVNDINNSLNYLELYLKSKEILDEEIQQEIVLNMQAKFDTEKKEHEIVEKDNEISNLQKDNEISNLQIQRNRIFQISLVVLILLIALTTYFIYRRYKIRKELNEILHDKNKELEEINATKNKFFSIISHDLSNYAAVLESVSGMIARKHEMMDAELLSQNLTTLNNSAIQNKKLIRNLLEWAIAQSRKIKLNPNKLDAYTLCNDTVSTLVEIAKKDAISLKLDIDENVDIYADENTVATVLRNLISNAIKFSNKDSEIKICVRENNNTVLFEIKDSGIGMSFEDSRKLFKADTNPKTIGNSSKKGTGFGLILCKEFVEMNKGNIFVESILGKGSTFSFTLPLCKQ